MHLGVGHPKNILACYDMGYTLFDSAMPTRDARHGRLYRFNNPETDPDAGLDGDWMSYVYIDDKKHIKSDTPDFKRLRLPVLPALLARFSPSPFQDQ